MWLFPWFNKRGPDSPGLWPTSLKNAPGLASASASSSFLPSGPEAVVQDLVKKANLRAPLRLPGLLEKTVAEVFDFIPFTPVANFTGQPAMSVPLVWKSGLPIGTMFTARFGDDATLFRFARQLEEARPWKDRRPPVHAAS